MIYNRSVAEEPPPRTRVARALTIVGSAATGAQNNIDNVRELPTWSFQTTRAQRWRFEQDQTFVLVRSERERKPGRHTVVAVLSGTQGTVAKAHSWHMPLLFRHMSLN